MNCLVQPRRSWAGNIAIRTGRRRIEAMRSDQDREGWRSVIVTASTDPPSPLLPSRPRSMTTATMNSGEKHIHCDAIMIHLFPCNISSIFRILFLYFKAGFRQPWISSFIGIFISSLFAFVSLLVCFDTEKDHLTYILSHSHKYIYEYLKTFLQQ